MSIEEEDLDAMADEVLRVSSSQKVVTFQELGELEEYQRRNRELVNTQLPLLNPRAVLFVGTIMTVTLPSSASSDGDESVEVFFRVLFCEGGNQPSMFRCKTPIYTSSTTVVAHNIAIWEDNTFRFDMIMPEGDSATPVPVQGEVMISFYRRKPNGGNELLSQFSVDLQRIRSRGTHEVFQGDGSMRNVEGRSMNGAFPLESAGQPAPKKTKTTETTTDTFPGEMEVQFNVAWFGQEDQRPSSAAPSRTTKRAVSPTTVERSIKSGAASKTTRPTSATRSGSASRRPQSATTTGIKKAATTTTATPGGPGAPSATMQYKYEAPRKIVSKLDRERREKERKIAKENAALHGRLSKHIPDVPDHQSTATASRLQTSAYQNYSAAVAVIKKEKEAGLSGGGRTAAEDTSANNNSNKPSSARDNWKKLQQLYDNLKKDVHDEEMHIVDLRGQLSNLQTQIGRQEAGCRRGIASSHSHTHSQHSTAASLVSTSAPPTARGPGPKAAAAATATAASGDEEGEDALLLQQSQSLGRPAQLVMPFEELGEFYSKAKDDAGVDIEYQQLAEEFGVLQRLRRSLLGRIEEAKKLAGTTSQSQQLVDQQLQRVHDRLSHLQRHHAGDFPDGVFQLGNAASAAPVAEAKAESKRVEISDKHQHGRDSKDARSSTTASTAADEKSTSNGNDSGKAEGKSAADASSSDMVVFDRVLSLRTELALLTAQAQENAELLALHSARQELQTMLHNVDGRCQELERQVGALRREKDELAVRSDDPLVQSLDFTYKQQQQVQRQLLQRRTFITDMRKLELQWRRQLRLDQLGSATKEIELQLVHYKMVSREREELRLQEDHLQHLQRLSRPQSPQHTQSRPGTSAGVRSTDSLLLPPSLSQQQLLAELMID